MMKIDPLSSPSFVIWTTIIKNKDGAFMNSFRQILFMKH